MNPSKYYEPEDDPDEKIKFLFIDLKKGLKYNVNKI